ncbi:MAG: hypothetical protein IT449_13295 [Phycisphaerales bacterium]|nr:hypothetical protein [Phycisphaerales bacterium]
MVDIPSTAKTILSEAETQLQELAIQAMRAADYDGSRRLANLAEDVRLLADRLRFEKAPASGDANGHSMPDHGGRAGARVGSLPTIAPARDMRMPGSTTAGVPSGSGERAPAGDRTGQPTRSGTDAHARPADAHARPADAHARPGNAHVHPANARPRPGDAPARPVPDDAGSVRHTARASGDARKVRRRAPAKGEYPKFFREGDTLIKVAWSKKQRAEYQHKAPRRAVDLLAAAIARKASRTGRFTTEELFPLKDPHDGAEVPSYQAYVALAWLKSAGMVRQKGKGGYTVKGASEVQEKVPPLWLTLLEA